MKKEVFTSFNTAPAVQNTRLCRPVDENRQETILFDAGIAVCNFHLQLRTIRIPEDIMLICSWMNDEYMANPFSQQELHQQLADMYRHINCSTYAQSFMVHLPSAPVCVVDICEVAHDEINADFAGREGDYKIRLLPDPPGKQVPGLYTGILHMTIRYCFGYPEVKRLIIEFDNAGETVFAQEAGWHFLQKVTKPWNEVYLYYMERSV
jgi:hypothetical protein